MRASGSRRLWAAYGPGTRRQVPALRVVRVDGYRPGVVAVTPLIGRLPGLASVRTEGAAAAARLVGAPWYAWVPDERVHVRLRAGSVVLPALAAVARAHEPTQLNPYQQ